MTASHKEEGMPAKKMSVRAKLRPRKSAAPHSDPSCDPKTGKPKATKKTAKKKK